MLNFLYTQLYKLLRQRQGHGHFVIIVVVENRRRRPPLGAASRTTNATGWRAPLLARGRSTPTHPLFERPSAHRVMASIPKSSTRLGESKFSDTSVVDRQKPVA